MKKTFPLHAPGKAAPRVVEAVKYDVRKYVKRERGKTLPEGFDLWEFNCRVGATAAAAAPTPLPDVGTAIDAVVATGATEVYLEIVAVAAHRVPRPILPGAPPLATATPPTEAPQSS